MLTVHLKGLAEAMASFDPAIVAKSAQMAMNESARSGRTAASKAIRTKWNVQARKVNQELKNIRFATLQDLTAIIQGEGRPISLTYFGAKEVRNLPRGKVLVQTRKSGKLVNRTSAARGVTVQIERGKVTVLPNAFMATTKSGHIGIFERVGKQRLPVKDMSSITIASMFQQQPVQDATATAVIAKWDARFPAHLDRLRR